MSGRALVWLGLVLALVPALAAPAPAFAQYMYLDANGDGIHTEADIVPDSGDVVADIWVVTNTARDGRPAVCNTGSESLTMNSYVVNVRATGGTVVWSSFTNRLAGFTTLPSDQDSIEFQGGAYNAQIQDPGRYRVATIGFSVKSGAPSVAIVPETKFFLGPTSFGSACGGFGFNNTQTLGWDWFDVDGLDHASANAAPALDPIEDVLMDENTTVTRQVTASDPDGEILSLTLHGLPPYATASATIASPGRVQGDVILQPSYETSVLYPYSPLVSAQVSDGVHVRQSSFRVSVRNVNRAPIITPISDVTVEVGARLEVPVIASDPDFGDDHLALALVEGPSFASFADGVVDLHPRLDAGTYTVRVSASDGSATTTASFHVTVTDSGIHHPPEFDPIPDVWVSEGYPQFVRVRARAAETDIVSIRVVQAPGYVLLQPDDGPGEGTADIWFTPGLRDSGLATVQLRASTSLYQTTTEFRVHVGDTQFPPTLESYVGCVEPGSRALASFFVYARESDSARVTCSTLPAWARIRQQEVGHPTGNYASPGILILSLEPGPEEPPSSVEITVSMNRGTPDEESWPATLSVSPYDACIEGEPFSENPPIPNAGGPYTGVAGAPVLMGAISNPGVSDSTYRWTFGDGHAALGANVAHAYGEGGTYRAIVRTSNHPLSRDSVEVVVADAFPARTLVEGALSVRYDEGFCVPWVGDGTSYRFADLDPSSVQLWVSRGGVADSINTTITEWIVNGGDEPPRLDACFSDRDFGRWFLGVRGAMTLQGRIQGRLANGARVRAPVTLELAGHAWDPRKVVARPNPLNPTGKLSFENPRAGRVSIRIFDVAGRLVRTLWDGPLNVGPVDMTFNGRNDRDEPLRSGVYYYQIESAQGVRTGRIAIVK